jgi:dihydrolipoamide dehydrogenase
MVATGRVPNTKNMGLEDRGIVTNRGFVAVNEYMQVMTQAEDGTIIPNVYCIGDANGKLMLAHAASAQGISAIENIVGRTHVVNHMAIPAAVRSLQFSSDCCRCFRFSLKISSLMSLCVSQCFTHPAGIAMVGPTEEQAVEMAAKEGWTLAKSTGSFRANSKALAEGEGNGMAKCLYKKETGEVVAVHIIGLNAADLIQECANAIAAGTTVQELSMVVHTHPTLSEVVDSMFKDAVGMSSH